MHDVSHWKEQRNYSSGTWTTGGRICQTLFDLFVLRIINSHWWKWLYVYGRGLYLSAKESGYLESGYLGFFVQPIPIMAWKWHVEPKICLAANLFSKNPAWSGLRFRKVCHFWSIGYHSTKNRSVLLKWDHITSSNTISQTYQFLLTTKACLSTFNCHRKTQKLPKLFPTLSLSEMSENKTESQKQDKTRTGFTDISSSTATPVRYLMPVGPNE